MPDDETTTTDETTSDDTTTEETTTTDETSTEDLGEGGKKALEAERKARAAAEKDAKATKTELEKLRKAQQSESEKALEAAKTEGRSEALTVAKARVLEEAVEAAASQKLAHPEDAARFLTLTDFEVGDDLKINKAALASAIDALVKERPELGRGATSTGSADQGARGGGPKQHARADLKNMTPEQIVAAQDAGQLDDLLTHKK